MRSIRDGLVLSSTVFTKASACCFVAFVEYDACLPGLRRRMAEAGVEASVFTSMHNIAYYSRSLYCAFGRPNALVVKRRSR